MAGPGSQPLEDGSGQAERWAGGDRDRGRGELQCRAASVDVSGAGCAAQNQGACAGRGDGGVRHGDGRPDTADDPDRVQGLHDTDDRTPAEHDHGQVSVWPRCHPG